MPDNSYFVSPLAGFCINKISEESLGNDCKDKETELNIIVNFKF